MFGKYTELKSDNMGQHQSKENPDNLSIQDWISWKQYQKAEKLAQQMKSLWKHEQAFELEESRKEQERREDLNRDYLIGW